MTEVVVIPPTTPSVVVVPPTPSPTSTSSVTVSGTTVGPQGPVGPTGPQGASGGFFTFTQNTPATTWSITHNLGYKPAVTSTDINGNIIVGDITYTSTNALTITFSGVIGGYAYMS
jgi:hypothetical protein